MLVEVSSKYETTVTTGTNMLLLPDDAEFISGSGNWVLAETGVSKRVRSYFADGRGRAFDADVTVTPTEYTITNMELTSNVAKLTTSVTHTFANGQMVVVSGVDPVFDGTYPITAHTTTTFSYAVTADNVVSVGATGTAYVRDNSLGTRGAAYAGSVARAYDAYVLSTPAPRDVTFVNLIVGQTTGDYVANSGRGVLEVIANDAYGTADLTIACGFGEASTGTLTPKFHGVPVEAASVYGFSAEYRFGLAGGTTVNLGSAVSPGIYWFDRDEHYLGEGHSTYAVDGTWQEVFVTDEAPATAEYAIPVVTVSGRANGDDFRMMGCMFYLMGDGGTVTADLPDRYLTLGTDELIGEASGKVLGG